MQGQPNPGWECSTDPLATKPHSQRTVGLLAQVGNGVGWGLGLKPFHSPLGTESKGTHLGHGWGQHRWPNPSGWTERPRMLPGALQLPGCRQGAAGRSASSFHPARKTFSLLVKDKCCGESDGPWADRGALCGEAGWVLSLASSSCCLTPLQPLGWRPLPKPLGSHLSPSRGAGVQRRDKFNTVQSSRIPATPHPWGGLPWWSSPTYWDIPLPIPHPLAPPANAGEGEAAAAAETGASNAG